MSEHRRDIADIIGRGVTDQPKCLGGCGFQEPYGFVPEADCPVHDRPGVKAWMDRFVAPLDRP
jgi:hypothetical protein